MQVSKTKRLVLKVGTGVLTREDGPRLDKPQFGRIAEAVAGLIDAGHECLLVSSGAVGAGLSQLGLETYPDETSLRQACAAVGQIQLLKRYEKVFRKHGVEVAQLLLTHQDIETKESRKRVQSTLRRLHSMGDGRILPIINENDSVAVEELKLGDNDKLAAQVAATFEADLLVLLTGVDGLLPPEALVAGVPSKGEEAPLPIPVVTDIEAALEMVSPVKGRFSMGGMASKLESIREATSAGVPALIASGRRLEQLEELVNGGGICTRFPA